MDLRRLGRARLAACKVSDNSHNHGRVDGYSEQQLNLKLVERNLNLVYDTTED